MIRRHFLVTTLGAALGLAYGDVVLAQKEKEKEKPQKEKQKQKKHDHHNGKQLVGDKIKKDGRHEIHKKGAYAASVDVKNGKIAGMHVKHDTKGEVPVKKYKTNQDMSQQTGGMKKTAFIPVQAQYLGTTWIGYAYVDDFGDEVIYWFPYDMILDGDTGAIEYVPAA
jgi:hypothetical protein